MTTKMKLLAFASAATMTMAAASADAAVLIEGTGFWGAGTQTTAYSQAGRSFQFSFTVPDVIPTTGSTATTTALGDFFYTLNNVAVGPATRVNFYSVLQNGMFDIVFGNTAVSIYGVDIGSDGTVGPSGGYAVTSGINGQFPGTGFGFVTVTALTAVPEPAAWAMMIAGVGAIGGALRFRRRSNVNVAVKYA